MDPMESIKATFFQECEELLGDLETGLLALEAGEGVSLVFADATRSAVVDGDASSVPRPLPEARPKSRKPPAPPASTVQGDLF